MKQPPEIQGDILNRLLQGLPYVSPAQMHLEQATTSRTVLQEEKQGHDTTGPRTLKTAIRELANRATEVSVEDVFCSLCELRGSDDIEKIERATRGQSTNNFWLEHRIGMITASVAHNVFTRVHTIRAKMGPHDVRPLLKQLMREKCVKTADMQRGISLEPTAKTCYLEQNHHHDNLCIQECGLFVLQDKPFIGASPDGVVTCACCPPRLLEVKCPKSIEKFIKSETRCEGGTRHIKHTSRYFCQAQVQMGATSFSATDMFVYVNERENITLNVPFSQPYFEDVIERCTFFFRHYLLPHILHLVQ